MKSILLILSALLTGFVAASVLRDRTNTPARYSVFQSEKTKLELGVNGAWSFMVTPVAMAGRSLNLGAWHGHQAMRLEGKWQSNLKLKLRFYLHGRGEIVVGLDGGGKERALRLSSRERLPSSWLLVNPGLRFEEILPLSIEAPSDRWVDLFLEWKEGRIFGTVGGVELPNVQFNAPEASLLFRGFSESGVAKIDDLSISTPTRSYSESFEGDFSWVVFGSVAAGAGIVLLLLPSLFFSTGLGGVALGVLLIQEFFLGSRYFGNVNLTGLRSGIEDRPTALSRLHSLPDSQRPLLLWLGGSQAWGAGASSKDRTVFSRLAASYGTPQLEWLNGAISGSTVASQREVLEAVAEHSKLSRVVLTVGVNDARNPDLERDLRELISAIREKGALTLLVPEPVEEPLSAEVSHAQEVVRSVGQDMIVSVAELQQGLEERSVTGFLWWDFVHLSDSGAEDAAEVLSPAIAQFLGVEVKGRHDLHQSPRPRK